MAGGQTPALAPEVADKYRKVVQLKTAGATFDEIADQVGYSSRSGAKMAYDRALKWWGRESVDELRTVEGERLEQLWRKLFARILADGQLDVGEIALLVNSALRVSQRKSALYGLDAPRQIEVAGQDGQPIVTDVGEMLRERMEEAQRATSNGVAQSLNGLPKASENGVQNGLSANDDDRD
ncbi:MAG: hypothetical protein ACR2NF_03770 [Pirellulales bacterium]|tara:strand:+ start:3877 stop:4419 length:543 start_codon:yes stop_codon:yes gene_type:complete